MRISIRTWISVFCGICIFLSGISIAEGQTYIQNPDSILQSGNSRLAMLAYAYREYRADDPIALATARLGEAWALKKMAQYASAGTIVDETALFGLPDSLTAALLYEGMLIHYLNKEPILVVNRYSQGQQLLESSQYKLLSQLLITSAYLDLHDWENAQEFGLNYIESLESANLLTNDSTYTAKWIAFFDPKNQPRLKKSKTARLLSMVFPGLGQMYSGSFSEGATNFLIVGGLAGITLFSAFQGYYLTAWLGGLGLLQRFYLSGIERAEELSFKKNRQLIETYLLPVKDFLIDLKQPTTYPST